MPPIVRARVKTKVKGDVDYKKLIRDVKLLGQKYVSVGILEPERVYPNSQATLGQVALWQEFGTHHRKGKKKGLPIIPPRSFLRNPVDENLAAINRLKAKLLTQVQDGTLPAAKALAMMGADMVRRIQTAIKKRIAPELRPSTLQARIRRGISGTIPLFATGFLYNNIHFAVRLSGPKGGGDKAKPRAKR